MLQEGKSNKRNYLNKNIMNEREYIESIEGLMVKIIYYYDSETEGVDIVRWSLLDESYDDYKFDYTEDEWEKWMADIDNYVYKDSMWDIIEFEKDLETY